MVIRSEHRGQTCGSDPEEHAGEQPGLQASLQSRAGSEYGRDDTSVSARPSAPPSCAAELIRAAASAPRSEGSADVAASVSPTFEIMNPDSPRTEPTISTTTDRSAGTPTSITRTPRTTPPKPRTAARPVPSAVTILAAKTAATIDPSVMGANSNPARIGSAPRTAWKANVNR
jgi:hypothetical protein